MNEEEIQAVCLDEDEKELRREEQKEFDKIFQQTMYKTAPDSEKLMQEMKSAGIIKQFKWVWSGECFFCNKKMSKGTIGYKAGLRVFEWFCSLECVYKALINNFCGCRVYLCLEDKSTFLEKIRAVKQREAVKRY